MPTYETRSEWQAAQGGGGASTPVETVLEGAVEGSADVISVPELKAAATTTESPTETTF